ncbi:MAG TPA: nucleotidyltransferase domain-containing protein [Bacteroidales bacterium]|nr:nucleotidyltransferase domain-containing protein [Bacteroidales bacterium]
MIKAKKEILRAINSTVRSVVPDATVILYGSQARGDSGPDSDWDILVILNKSKIEPNDFNRVMYPLYELGWENGQHFSVKLYSKADWMKRSYTLFYKNVESEGILL